MSAGETPAVVRCRECGSDNPGPHKFCGKCGAALGREEARHERVPGNFRVRGDSATDSTPAVVADSQYESSTTKRPYEADAPNSYDLSLLRSFRSAEYAEESSHPYLVYAGVILAIMIAVLAYMAWRSSQRQGLHAIPAASPAATHDTAAMPEAPANSANGTPTRTAQPPEPKQATPQEKEATRADRDVRSKAMPAGKSAPDSVGPAIRDNGSEELAMAQRYLGANGQPRDPGEAAKWLWKSIAKHNGEATLLLADLYLKGDGVSKNCDQARVLLDSAGRKGVPGAGERLRNLQAFNCQ